MVLPGFCGLLWGRYNIGFCGLAVVPAWLWFLGNVWLRLVLGWVRVGIVGW